MNKKPDRFRTEQEEFWSGDFGRDYSNRNSPEKFLAANIAMFSRILSRMERVDSVIELGANIGLNLEAIRSLLPAVQMSAVEINAQTCRILGQRLPDVDISQTSLLDLEVEQKFDLVLIKGVLIHVNPQQLPLAYEKLATLSARYVLIAEYYSPTPVSIEYRGHRDRLYKRDFAGEFLDRYSDFRLLDYGFVWRRDPLFSQDDLNWFLLERRAFDSLSG